MVSKLTDPFALTLYRIQMIMMMIIMTIIIIIIIIVIVIYIKQTHCVRDGLRWAGHVARMGKERGVYRVLVGKPEGNRPLGRPRRRWVDNIRMDLQEVGCGVYGLDWDGPGQRERELADACECAVMNLGGVSVKCEGIFLDQLQTNKLASQEGLCTVE